jgi:5-bromo-4-chloroindolyl phosphate hydrolysis protein
MPRGKTNAIEQLINSKYSNGVEITVAQLAAEIGCTVQNVYIYIRKNPSRFSQVRRGVYQIHPHASNPANQSSGGSMTMNA